MTGARALLLLLFALVVARPVDGQATRKKTTVRAGTATRSSARARATSRLKSRPAAADRTSVTPRKRARPVRRAAAPAMARLAARSPFGLDALRGDLGFLAGTSIRTGSWGMMVVSLSQGDTLFSINADVPHQPASTQKVLTSVLALNSLGANYRYHTDVLHTGTLRDGRLDGDLILRGDGDPSLSSRFVGRTPDAAMDSLVGRLVRAGVRQVSGRVIGDASGFEARSAPIGAAAIVSPECTAGSKRANRACSVSASGGAGTSEIRRMLIGRELFAETM